MAVKYLALLYFLSLTRFLLADVAMTGAATWHLQALTMTVVGWTPLETS